MKAKGTFLMVAGLGLILAAGGLMAYNSWDDARAGEASQTVVQSLEEVIVPQETVPVVELEKLPVINQPDYFLFPDMEMPIVTVDGMDYVGILSIPALELELPILSEWTNSGGRIAPCRYSGSLYTDDMVIAGHNYVQHFHDLKNLAQGDLVRFTDADGNQFQFSVENIEVLPATAIDDMCISEWDLTLFTCTYSGNDRVTIRCERV